MSIQEWFDKRKEAQIERRSSEAKVENITFPGLWTKFVHCGAQLTNKDLEYDKTNAIADAQATVDNIFDTFKDELLVQVYQPECIANGYNSTSMQLLVNNAYAKTVSEGAKVVLDNIQRYAGIRVSDLQVMSQLIGAIRNSKTVGDIYRGQIQDFSWVTSTGELITSIFNNNVNPNTKPAA